MISSIVIAAVIATQDLLEAYRYAVKLAKTGADVARLVDELNRAAAGSGQVASIIANATALLLAARQMTLMYLVLSIGVIIRITATAAVIYLRGARF